MGEETLTVRAHPARVRDDASREDAAERRAAVRVGRAKEHNLRRDQRIAICIEDEYRYVTLSGTADLIEDQPTAQADIKRLAERYHPPEKAAEMVRNQFSKEQRMTLRMKIERVIEDL